MARRGYRIFALVLGGLVLSTATVLAGDPTVSLKKGTPQLKSAGPLGFGPDGILFVGDTQGASLFAIDSGDRTQAKVRPTARVKDVTGKLATLLGTNAKSVMVNDLAVNPISGNVYMSVSRGRGPEAVPVLVRVLGDGKLDEVSLENVRFARAEIPNSPGPNARERGQSLRSESITDIAYVDGRVFIAGLSNEEFSSRLIAIPFPFSEGFDGAAIEIYHGAHGRFETRSPIRTFTPYRIGNDPYLLAAYTCTPLVKVPVADLKAGSHVKGTTIAELGNRNRPLDMVPYRKDGKDFLLLANSSRGVMKIPTEGAGEAAGITSPVSGTKGLGYETLASFKTCGEEFKGSGKAEGLTARPHQMIPAKGVVQLDKLDDSRAVVMVQDQDGTLNLDTVELP